MIVPFWCPMWMPLRFFLGGASLGEVALSLGILLVSTIVVIRLAAKIYRVGILMYGKRPGLRELVRWLRYCGFCLPLHWNDGIWDSTSLRL